MISFCNCHMMTLPEELKKKMKSLMQSFLFRKVMEIFPFILQLEKKNLSKFKSLNEEEKKNQITAIILGLLSWEMNLKLYVNKYGFDFNSPFKKWKEVG